MTMLPDRGHLETEQRHALSYDLDALATREAVALLVDDHRAVPAALDAASEAITALIDDLVPRMRRGGRLVYVGAGTSGRLGVLDAAECPPTFQSDPAQVVGVLAGGDAALRRSSEGREDDPDGAADALATLALTADDMVVGIAAGGTTPYVLGALRIGRAAGARTAFVTCAAAGAAAAADGRGAPGDTPPWDHLVHLDTGPELLTGSTRLKAGSATKLALNIITTVTFTRLGKVYSNLMVDVRATNDKLRDRSLRILRELCPGLSRATAADALRAADGNLKVAIMMQRTGSTATEAATTLAQCHGNLRTALERDRKR